MTAILSVAGIIILRPLTRRLGDALEAKSRAKHKQPELSGEEIARLTDVMGRLTDRIESLEERQDFTERLLSDQKRAPAQARLRDTAEG
jgi:hypothetical protein